MRQPQLPADIAIGGALVRFLSGCERRRNVDPILFIPDQALQQLEVLDRDDRRAVLLPPVDDNPLPPVLRAVQDIGQ
jgi:hypothetical protein